MRLALQFRHEGLIDDAETMRRVTPEQVEMLLLPALEPETRLAATLLAKACRLFMAWFPVVPTPMSMRHSMPPI